MSVGTRRRVTMANKNPEKIANRIKIAATYAHTLTPTHTHTHSRSPNVA